MGSGLSVLTTLSGEMPVTDPAECKHMFCEKWGPGHFHCADCHSTVTDKELMAEEDRTIDGIVDESVPEDAVHRGVTIQFLIDFTNACNCWDMTTRDVRRRFVMPATRASRCRFVELPEMVGIAGKASTFVSHTWGAKFGDLVSAVMDGNADRNRVVWVDIFAVRQWPSHKPDLDFSAVVRQCKSFLIVCSSQPEIEDISKTHMMSRNIQVIPPHVRAQVAFLRVWCLVEIHAALQSECIIVMKSGQRRSENQFHSSKSMLENMFFFIDVNSAEATVEFDRQRILNDINSTTGVQAVNEAVRSSIAGGVISMDYPVVMCAACGDAAALQELFSQPSKFMVAVAGCGYIDLLKQLIDRGGSLKSGDDLSPLVSAALGGHKNCIDLILNSGGFEDIATSDEAKIALVAAAMGGHTSCVELLINKGVSSGGDLDGKTALMQAAMGGHTACVEFLLRSGASTNGESEEDLTALQYASQGGHKDCVDLIINSSGFGEDVTASDDVKKSISLAEKEGHTACVEFLRKSVNASRGGTTECIESLSVAAREIDL